MIYLIFIVPSVCSASILNKFSLGIFGIYFKQLATEGKGVY